MYKNHHCTDQLIRRLSFVHFSLYISNQFKVSSRNVIPSGFLLTRSPTRAEGSWECEILQAIFVEILDQYFPRRTRKFSGEYKFQVQPEMRHKYRAKYTRFVTGAVEAKLIVVANFICSSEAYTPCCIQSATDEDFTIKHFSQFLVHTPIQFEIQWKFSSIQLISFTSKIIAIY